MDDLDLSALATAITEVDGVIGVLLGGSRAREAHTPSSDYDLGIYYRRPLDVDGLRLVARQVDDDATLTELGAWGPWVDGGGWLSIGGIPVDWIYRDADRVRRAWADAQVGRFYFHGQVGHPLGVPDFAYAGEVALGRILCDPTGELTELKEAAAKYPPHLTDAVVGRLGEASFLISGARKGAARGDTSYVAGCLFRVFGLCAHAIHANAERWLINEKGAVDASSVLPGATDRFAERAHGVFSRLDTTVAHLQVALDDAQQLVDETSIHCGYRP